MGNLTLKLEMSAKTEEYGLIKMILNSFDNDKKLFKFIAKLEEEAALNGIDTNELIGHFKALEIHLIKIGHVGKNEINPKPLIKFKK